MVVGIWCAVPTLMLYALLKTSYHHVYCAEFFEFWRNRAAFETHFITLNWHDISFNAVQQKIQMLSITCIDINSNLLSLLPVWLYRYNFIRQQADCTTIKILQKFVDTIVSSISYIWILTGESKSVTLHAMWCEK